MADFDVVGLGFCPECKEEMSFYRTTWHWVKEVWRGCVWCENCGFHQGFGIIVEENGELSWYLDNAHIGVQFDGIDKEYFDMRKEHDRLIYEYNHHHILDHTLYGDGV